MSLSSIPVEWERRLPGLSRLWSATEGDPAITVAVLDGPVAARNGAHPSPGPAMRHGTLVASVIESIAPGCRLLSIPIFADPPEGGSIRCSQADLAAAIHQAVGQGARIINVSAAEESDALGLTSELAAALKAAFARDILVVAAAGNGGCACDTLPASAQGVLAVGAHGEDGEPLASSNWGFAQRGGLIAPGAALPGACVDGGLCRGSGTSFAAAVVSGVAALLMSLDLRGGRAPDGSRIRRILLESSQPCRPESAETCATALSGRLDVDAAAARLTGSTAIHVEGEGRVTMDLVHAREEISPTVIPAAAPGAGTPLIGVPPDLARGASPEPGLRPAHADCGCGGKTEAKPEGSCGCAGAAKGPPPLVYAIGRLGVSFVSQSRRDAIWRRIHGLPTGGRRMPEIDTRPVDNASLRQLIADEPWQSQGIVWTLNHGDVAMYAIVPSGAFAAMTYEWLFKEWSDDQIEFISQPGIVAGRMTLYDGVTVDAVVPDLRGMYSWDSRRYIEALAGHLRTPPPPRRRTRSKTEEPDGRPEIDPVAQRIDRFLRKIYYRMRNRGLLPEERALNAAATNAFNFSDVVVEAGGEGLAFRDITVERSPLSRPGSDYYDVLLTFFDPAERMTVANLVARFTVDVGDTVPVIIDGPASWYEY